ncbi:hypothetical protein [Photobacterium leiognathi]|uniref:hypothetical protein n=1 Tax=Photobacterium leiognathi TaxID=553611 RepID=UPI003D9FBFFB
MSFDDLTRFNDDEIKQLKEEIWNAPVVYEWDAVEWGVTEFSVFMFALIVSLIMPLSFAVFSGEYTIDLFLFWVLMFFMAYFMYRFLFMPKEINHYQLTAIGIRYTSQADIPGFVYTAVRYIAWGGVLLSVFAMAVMGPLALIGAGGFALLAVGFVNYKPEIKTDEFFFLDKVNIKMYKKRNIIRLFTDCYDVRCMRTIYINDDIYPFFNALSKQVTISNYSEVKSRRDF